MSEIKVVTEIDGKVTTEASIEKALDEVKSRLLKRLAEIKKNPEIQLSDHGKDTFSRNGHSRDTFSRSH
jgi:hypothetical protein